MKEKLTGALYPLITFGAILALWLVAVYVWDVPSYVLPKPLAVLGALKTGYIDGLFWHHFFYTLSSTAMGYIIGCVAAICVGAIVSEWRIAERLINPLVIALQSMPKVALAPLILVWFGFDQTSKVIMVVLVCFFPVFVNTVVGLKQTPADLLEMARAANTGRWRTFWEIRFPSAAGHIFAGLQIAIVLSLIGAVVAEFVSSSEGLGYLINASALTMEVNVMFAALVSLAAMGVIGTQIVRFAHSKLVFWEGSLAATVQE
ncbi:ABC transporter permease [Pseudooceanicola sp. 502str34]